MNREPWFNICIKSLNKKKGRVLVSKVLMRTILFLFSENFSVNDLRLIKKDERRVERRNTKTNKDWVKEGSVRYLVVVENLGDIEKMRFVKKKTNKKIYKNNKNENIINK